MEALLWTVALLVCAHKNQGQLSSSPPALTPALNLDEVISVPLRLTSKIDVNIVPSNQNNSSQGASTAFHPPSTYTTVGTDISESQSSKNTAVSDHITSHNTKQASSVTSPTLVPVTSTMVSPGSTINTMFTSRTEESHISSHPSTFSFSETTAVVSSAPPSGISSTVPTDQTKTTEPISLEYPRQNAAPELDVGDEDSPKVPRTFPLDPLLAGLTSVFIVSTALVAVVLFLRFRQQNGRPEFQRLQDLPMDDLLEDTPLSRYAY